MDIHSILDFYRNTTIAKDINTKYIIWNSSRTNIDGNLLERYISSKTDTTIAAPDSLIHYLDNPNHAMDVFDIAIVNTDRF